MKRKLLLLLMAFIATSYSYGQYCAATGGGDEYISGVEIGSISNTGTGDDGYHDYTALSTDLYQGQSGASITITNGTSYGSDDVGVWIDWNQDSDFEDADENVVCEADNGGQGTFTFDVPAGATLGNTVMRVRIKYSGSDCGSSCGTTTFGEVEDYTINVTTPPSCPAPTDQTEGSITSSSVSLGWTENGTATSWNIEYGASGYTQGTGTTVSGVTNPYTLSSGLTANTTYDWYVQADCGSTWTGPSSFTTLQTPAPVQSLPFAEDWETGAIGTAWNYDAGSVSTIEVNTASAHNGTYGLEQYGNSTGYSTPSSLTDAYTKAQSGGANENWTTWNKFSVDLTSSTNPWLSFWYAMGYQYNDNYNNFWVQVSTDGTSWTDLFSTQTNGAAIPYEKKDFDLSAYNGTAQLYIRFFHNGKYSTNYLWVDDITVQEVSCPAPTDQTESNITTTTADLSWTENGGATSWNIEYGSAGFTPTGTPTVSGVTNPYTLSGLTAATSYDWYVQADCGSSGSTWTGPSTFSTECPAKVTSFPYTTDFENGGLIPNCWTNDPTDAGGEWEFTTNNYHGPTADHTTGSGYYALLNDYYYYSSDSPFNLLTPVFDLSTPNKWYKVSYWAWIGPDGANNPIYFEVSLDGGTTWKTLYTHDHSTTGTWFKTSIDLGFNKSANVVFRFRGMSIYGYSTDNSGIDDFTIEETQAPPVPLSDWAIYAGVFFILSFLVIRFKRRLA